ncbi:BPL1 [Candida jiufengensis]|uniref:BPL1 n=1 Tax=Candida jiufengensis TaxID=497108 RepID=UPI0022254A03|nr:BPL1 [Candida jiufengensis]KAI5957349.1 BPL1 [Candida jiufengensis]
MNVLVYSGPGTTTESVKHCLESLRLHLANYYAVLPVNETVLLTEPWMRKTSMLVIPGGADLPYCNVLNGEGNRRITKYVKNGGRYMGFCAGAYYASARCEFDIGGPLEVTGSRELAFFPGTSRGCAFKGFDYESHSGARAAKLVTNTHFLPKVSEHTYNYYNGGGIFMNASSYKDVEVLARYEEKTDIEDDDKAAIIYRKIGKGDVILTGSHPEFTPNLFKNVEPGFEKVVDKLNESDQDRKILMRELLKKIGLRVSEDVDSTVPKVTPMYIASPFENNSEQLYKLLKDKLNISGPFKDTNDTFIFQDEHSNHQYNDTEEEVEDPNSVSKYINFITSNNIPSNKMTPYFNMQKYFENLKKLSSNAPLEFGNFLGYSEVITSTNTILDKNPNWLEHLPNGFTLTASTQIAGRGRGGNVWINPRGVLATSILFKVPQSPQASSSIVSLQYLCGLALIEAILGYGSEVSGKGIGYEDMPLRLKWPNDIFILKPEYFDTLKHEVSTTVDGDDEKYVKVSGALINSQYINGTFNLVWGGGVNVSNPAPTTSLNLVLEKLNEIRKSNNLPVLPPYEPELLLAKLIFTIDQFYKVFKKSGLKPFLPLYYKRWFHSNQKVDVENNGQTRICIIKGITPDYGLLIAEDIDNKEVLHLQPDGNSFDIFKGLVYKKNT